MKNNLDILRSDIDDIDKKIVELLGKRTEVVKKIGQYKKQNEINFLNEKRREEVLESRIGYGKQFNLDSNFIKSIFNLIHEFSVGIEKKTK